MHLYHTSESFHGHQPQPRYSSPADPFFSGAGDVHVLFPGLQADQLRADLVGEEEDPSGQHLPAGSGRRRGLSARGHPNPRGQDEADPGTRSGLRQDPPHRLW